MATTSPRSSVAASANYSPSVTPQCEFQLASPPSCIDFVPGCKGHFVVGTYELEPQDSNDSRQSRRGSLGLFELQDSGLMIQHDFLSCQSAIYDLHFLEGHQILTPQTFAAVSSTGSISFYHVQTSESDGSPVSKIIPLLIDVPLFSEQTIITYFAFLPPVGVDEFGPLIAATTNNGGVYLIRYDLSAGSIDVLGGGEPIHRHMLMGVPENAWCCTFHTDTDGTTSVCSGGDDSELEKIHDAGVTAILPLPSSIADGSSLLLTGSYDDHIRLYSMGIEKELGSMYLGGGVYRLKMLKWIGSKSSGERQSFLILACCMHAGTKLVEVCSDLGGETYTMTVVGTLKVPTDSGDNYCYAASAIPGVMGGKAFVSGTYVDKKLTSWRYKAEEGVEENQK